MAMTALVMFVNYMKSSDKMENSFRKRIACFNPDRPNMVVFILSMGTLKFDWRPQSCADRFLHNLKYILTAVASQQQLE